MRHWILTDLFPWNQFEFIDVVDLLSVVVLLQTTCHICHADAQRRHMNAYGCHVRSAGACAVQTQFMLGLSDMASGGMRPSRPHKIDT